MRIVDSALLSLYALISPIRLGDLKCLQPAKKALNLQEIGSIIFLLRLLLLLIIQPFF
jgi:hypothetical protein